MPQYQNTMDSVDVLLICALKDEYDQVLKVTDGLQTPGWHEHSLDDNGWIVADGIFTTVFGSTLSIRATHSSYMGREQAQATASALINKQPARCIAMSGICAGRRGKVSLGDVIFAERLWSYDTGKLTEENGKQIFQADPIQYNPSTVWVQRMQHVTPCPSSTPWLNLRPTLPLEHQEDWVLLRVLAGEDPCQHSEFNTACPNWSDVLQRLWKRKWLEKPMVLTSEGRQRAEELDLLYPDGLPTPPSFKIHVAPMATGAAVSEDKSIFPRLAESMRKVLGIEMEASALGALGEVHNIPVLVAKGVSDYGDSFKDDRYREFAARAAAECLISLLRNSADLLLLNNKDNHPPETFSTTTSFSNPKQSEITESSSSIELEQLRSELGKAYAEKLDSILTMRGSGQIEEAWEKLTTELTSLNGNQIPPDVQSRYYYHAARWAQEDNKPVEQYTRFYETALRLNSQLDDRTYRAFEFMAKEQIDDAINVLLPLDTEPVILSLLKCLLHSNQFLKVDELMSKLTVPVTDEIQRLQSLCCLAAGNANQAWQILEPALSKNQNDTVFQLTAGYIAFWQAVPVELHPEGVLPPQFFIPNLFSLDDNHERLMRAALGYLEQALNSLSTELRKEIKDAVISAYLAVCVCLPDKHTDAIAKAKTALLEDPIDPSAVLCLIRLATNHEWTTQTLDVLHQTCEKPNPPLWQIEMLVELLLHIGQIESVWQYLSRFEYRFLAENKKIHWFDRAIYSLASLNKLSELENKITKLDDCAENLRIKVSYWLRTDEFSKALNVAKELVDSPGTRLDYSNLLNLYYQKHMWQELTDFATFVLERFKEDVPAHIVNLIAQAWMNLDKPLAALEVLEKYRYVFEHDRQLNVYYAACKVVHSSLGQYPQAWDASEQLWNIKPNEQLLVERAHLKVMMGDASCAVEILKQGIKQGFKSPQVLMQIAHYTLPNDREAAFQYAKEAVECFPDNPQLLQAAMMIGFDSGHSDWAGMQLAILHQKFPDSGLVQEIKLPTILEWGQEYQERSREHWQQFLAGQLPLHLLLDSRRTSLGLGAEFYWRWHHNHNKPLCQHVPFPIAYAGRTVKPFDDWKSNMISMDYSACLIAHQLKLFSSLAESFETIYIPPSLLGLIQSEIHRLAEVQTDRVEQAEILLKQLNELPITLLPVPDLEYGDFNGLKIQDRIEWVLAEKENLLIVTDQFATELFESGSIPPALESLRVSYTDVFTALENRGELSLDDSPVKQTLRYTIDLERVEQLADGTKLLVDSPFLERLIQLNVLEATSRIFQLYCVDNISTLLNDEIESYQYRQKIKNSLESLQTELKCLLSKGKLKCISLNLI